MTERSTHILMVSCAGPPKSSPESLQVSRYLKYLIRQHRVAITLVTEKLPSRNFGWRTLEPEYENLAHKIEQAIELPVYYNRWVHGILKRVVPGLFHRPDNESLFTRSPRRVLSSLKNNPEVIYSRSTPFSSAVLAKKIKDRLAIPWLMHLSDPWVESPHFQPPERYRRYHENLEAECFSKADRISFTTLETKQLYEAKYPHFEYKYLVMPNVYDDDYLRLSKTLPSGPLRIVHTGNFYGQGRRPNLILQQLKDFELQYPDLHHRLNVIFTGFLSEESKADFRQFDCQSAHHLGPIKLSDVIKLQHNADLLLLIDWELPPEQAVFQLSKSVDYVAARRPILAITSRGSAIHKMVDGKFGLCLEHWDKQGLSSILKDLIANGRSSVLLRDLDDVGNQYSASKNALKLKEVLLSMASHKELK